jgi:DNA topoisomerase IA
MRTDDTSFAAEFLPTLKSYIEGAYGKSAYTKPRVGKKQENGQEGHECLRVTDPSITPEILIIWMRIPLLREYTN